MKLYFYVLRQFNTRTLIPLGKTCGVLQAEDSEQALNKVNLLIGNVSSLEMMEEFYAENGFSYTVYRSSM